MTAQTTHHFQCKTCASFNIYGFLNIIKNYKYLRSPITLKKKASRVINLYSPFFFFTLQDFVLHSFIYIYYRTQFSLTLFFSAIVDASIEQSLIFFSRVLKSKHEAQLTRPGPHNMEIPIPEWSYELFVWPGTAKTVESSEREWKRLEASTLHKKNSMIFLIFS